MRLSIRYLNLAAFAALSSVASAQITWDSTTVSSAPDLLDEEAKAVFAFTNTGEAPVEIVSVKPSCGCTATQLAKRRYEPGESGEITASMRIGSRTGKQQKTIRVQSAVAGGARDNVVLTMSFDLPEYAKLSPAVLVWRDPEPREPKKVSITLTDSLPIEVTGILIDGKAFSARLEKVIGEERKYEVLIAPPPVDVPSSRSTVRIDTSIASKKGRQLSIRLFVLPEGQSRSIPGERGRAVQPSEDGRNPSHTDSRVRRSTPIRRSWPRRQS